MKDALARIVAAADGKVTGQDAVQRSLSAIRRHLDMDVAYVSEFSNNTSIFRKVDAPGLEHLLKAGDTMSLDDVYCRHILEGRLPQLIPDTSLEPLALSLPITYQAPIGKHVSVPIIMPDGTIYGMFCCLGARADSSLRDRDLEVLKVFADVTAAEIAQQRETARQLRARVDIVQAIIDSGDLTIHYQPLWRIGQQRPVGFECLSRFPREPYLTPDKWFAEAAELGLGAALELVAIEQAIAVLPQLPDDIYLAINVSPDTVLAGGLENVLANVPPSRIVLEITEHALVDDYGRLIDALGPFRRRGIKLAVDDAGAGYSCLQHILQLRPDLIKLDMALTRDIDSDPARKALAAALVAFAGETGARIIAEGVETEAELATLQSIGVAKAQGYLLGKPMPFAKAQALFADANTTPGAPLYVLS